MTAEGIEKAGKPMSVPETIKRETNLPENLQEEAKKRVFTIRGDGTFEYTGFRNLYEVLGFIDIHMNPQALKQSIMTSAQTNAQQNTQKK